MQTANFSVLANILAAKLVKKFDLIFFTFLYFKYIFINVFFRSKQDFSIRFLFINFFILKTEN